MLNCDWLSHNGFACRSPQRRRAFRGSSIVDSDYKQKEADGQAEVDDLSGKQTKKCVTRVLFLDFGLALLRRAALLARTLAQSWSQSAVAPPLLLYVANFRD